MFKAIIIYFLFLITLSPSLASAEMTFSQYENEYEVAYREKEYAFRLVPQFYKVLSMKGYAPALNFSYIKWKYRNEMLKHPQNPFLAFCLGELYRYRNEYEEAFKYYDAANKKAGENVFKHTMLLALFSERKLLQWQIKEEEKLIGLKKDFGALSLPLLSKYFFIRAREAAESGPGNEIEKGIRIAKELDPYNPGIQFFYIRFLLLNARFEFFDEFLTVAHTFFFDFQSRLYVIIFTYNFLFTFLTILLSGFVIAYFLKYFLFVVSKLFNFFPHNLSMSKRNFLSITLLLLPLIWTMPSLWTFIFMLVIPIPFLERKERWGLQFLILFLLILSVLGSTQTRAYTAMDPTQKIVMLDNMQKSRFDPALIRRCDSLIVVSPKDFSIYFLKGLQFKRGGFFDEAEENYREAISLIPELYQTYNNLGNVFFWEEEIDSSIKYYEQAIRYESKSPAPHYNLAQAYVRKLLFDKSSFEMKSASQLDFELISKQIRNAKEINNHFLIDLTLPQEMLWIEFFSLKEDKHIFPWKYIGFDYRIFSALLIFFFLLLIIIPRIVKNIKDQCPICTSPISKGNSQMFENEIICWRCYGKLSHIHSLDIKERLKDKINTDVQKTLSYNAILWGLFLPGLGHLQLGKGRRGTFYLLIFSILCSLLLLSRVTNIAFIIPFSKETNFGTYIIISFIVLLYLFSLLSLFGSSYEERK